MYNCLHQDFYFLNLHWISDCMIDQTHYHQVGQEKTELQF
jgi:hypothetical protein